MHVTKRLVLSAVAVLSGVTAACGGTSDGGTRTSTTASTTAGATTSTTVTRTGSAGCGRPADVPTVKSGSPGDVEQTLNVGGRQRIYRLGVPPSYDPDRPTPLVVNLHGSGSNAIEASVYGRVDQEGSERNMITVVPQAIGGEWQLPAEGSDRDFLLGLVEDMKARYCIDVGSVHMIGMSLGAWKAAVTACAAPDVFASAVLVTVEVHPNGCPPIPVVAFHGTADSTVPYGEGSGMKFPDSPNAGLPGVHVNIANWAQGNGCEAEPDKERIGDDVEKWTYRGCAADVVLHTIVGGGHTWPGADIDVGPTTQTIDATELGFDWFEAHRRTSG